MKDHFKRLFEYDRWANQQVYNTLAANDVIDDRIISLFSHVLWATGIWHLRLTNQPMPLPYMPFAEMPYDEMQTRINNQFDNYIAFIEQVTDFNSTCTYTDLKGNQHTTALYDIFTHVANHATYHRGQLASRIKELGLQPPGTDYILFTRI
jgi:uncharacterized damage-inducible protein DinB